MSLPRHKTSNRGFTLVELLVVISIIAILAVLASAGWTTALRQAQKAKCASNLRQIGIAMLAYSGDNNGNLPISGAVITHHGDPDPGTKQEGWTDQLEPYLGSFPLKTAATANPIFRCPDSSKSIPTCKYYSYFNGSHAAGKSNGGNNDPSFVAVTLLKMHSPSLHIIAGDINITGLFTQDDADKDDYGDNNPSFGSPITIHGGYVNLVFADGHLESVKSFDKTKMTTVYPGPGYDYTADPP